MPKLSESESLREELAMATKQCDHHLRNCVSLTEHINALRGELADGLALLNKHLSGRTYDNLDDALRNMLQAFVTNQGNIETLEGDLAEAKVASQCVADVIVARDAEIKKLYAQMEPNLVCGHPMACWVECVQCQRGGPSHQKVNGVCTGSYCRICREKEAAVAAALGQVFDHPFMPFLGKCKCGWSCNANSSLPCYEQWKQHIRAITPTQTSAQQGWVTNPGGTGYGRIKTAWDSAQQERK